MQRPVATHRTSASAAASGGIVPSGVAVPPARRAADIPVIPANALVLLIGASASGKSSWARRWFLPTQVVSSDRCRALVCDDEANQSVNREAFAVFYEIVGRRLELGRLTVADSTALGAFSRARLRELAANAGAPAVAVVVCTRLANLRRNNGRRGRRVPDDVLERHAVQLRELVASGELEREGYAGIHYLHFPALHPPRIVAPTAPLDGPGSPGREP
jgi:protein phosphatase